MGKPIEQINEVDWCDNTAVSIIDFNDAFEPTVVLANDASHLSGETSTFQNNHGGNQKIVSKQNGMRRCFNENHGS